MAWQPGGRSGRRKKPRPYPLAPLAAALGLGPGETSKIAQAVGVGERWVKRYRNVGLTDDQADRWAAHAGLHPLSVWPLWGADLPPAGLVNANKVTCPAGHPYDRIDSRGYRICSTCTRERITRWRKKSADPQVTQLVTPMSFPEAS